jgi:L,D-transpeptidase catalytic domain
MTPHPHSSSETGARRRSRSLGRLTGRLAGGALTLVLATSALPGVTTALARSRHVRPTQALAELLHGQRVHRSPTSNSRVVATISAHRPITGAQTTLPVIGRYTGRHGMRWLRVMLPGRPNNFTGWIAQQGTSDFVTGWHIVVDTSRRYIWVYYHGRVARSFPAVVGKPSTPTPSGNFFVEESEIMPSWQVGGPYALALSARSNVLQEFDGGPGQIAIHGRDSLGGTLGQAESHGCMRLATGDITWLAMRIGAGTPVTIYG